MTTVLWISPRWNIHQGGDLRSNVYFLKIYDVSRFSWMNVSSSKPSCRHYESVVWGSFSVGAYVAFQPCGWDVLERFGWYWRGNFLETVFRLFNLQSTEFRPRVHMHLFSGRRVFFCLYLISRDLFVCKDLRIPRVGYLKSFGALTKNYRWNVLMVCHLKILAKYLCSLDVWGNSSKHWGGIGDFF